MKQSLVKILFVLSLCFALPSLYAQNDTIKKKKKSIFQPTLDSNNGVSGFFIGKKQELSPIFNLNRKEQIPLKGFDYYLNLGSVQPKPNLQSLSNNTVDGDVLVKRYFNGKDTSDPKLESHVDLGSIESSTAFIRIDFRDFGLVDGDIVRIYQNGKLVEDNIMLIGIPDFIELKMERGYNRIDFNAKTNGRIAPNTAEFLIFDDKGNLIKAGRWGILKSQNATLSVINY